MGDLALGASILTQLRLAAAIEQPRQKPGGWNIASGVGRTLLEVLHVFLRDERSARVDHLVDRLAVDRFDETVQAELRHLLWELRDRGVFLTLGDCVFLATAEVEPDQDHLVIELGVLDRRRGARGRRAARRVDGFDFRMGRQDVFGDLLALIGL